MIRTEKLNKTYDRKQKNANHVLKDISLTLPDTGFICILGPSGCGKTTLLNTIGGLDTFDSGSITAGEVTASRYGTRAMEAERNQQFGYIFQNYYLLPERSVGYNVYLGLHSVNISHLEKLKRVRMALQAVQMEQYVRRNVNELSGGQKQRVAIARALARRPEVIFADEPTGNLDEANTMNICTLLRQISRSCLVVMVTHEERIAHFFADRIITLEDGRILSDITDWPRDPILMGENQNVYTGDYQEEHIHADQADIRVLGKAGAKKVKLTLLVQDDRIIVKMEDDRSTALALSGEPPYIKEGTRPVLTIQEVDAAKKSVLIPESSAKRGGRRGFGFRMLLQEALRLMKGHGKRQIGLWVCLITVTMLMVFTVGDYMTVATVHPEDFIHKDSHILEVKVERGSLTNFPLSEALEMFLSNIQVAGGEFDYLPVTGVNASYSYSGNYTGFDQVSSIKENVIGFSYLPIDKFNQDTLISGRMPELVNEVVIDRWVLDAMLERNAILGMVITDLDHFLGEKLTLDKKNLELTIVGICDGGTPAMYVDRFALLSIASAGVQMMSISQLQEMYPGTYDDIKLQVDEILLTPKSGRSGSTYSLNGHGDFKIMGRIEDSPYASIIVSDESYDMIMHSIMLSISNFYVYAEDREQAKTIMKEAADPLDILQVTVKDHYGDNMAAYQAAAQRRLNSRQIVVLAIAAAGMIMEYLLLKARISERKGMIAVYRLLGVPRYQTILLFAAESFFTSLAGTLPAALATWGVLSVLTLIPSIAFEMVLPFTYVLLTWCFLFVFHLIASILPAVRFLRLPPAVLAAQYDI